MNFQRYLATDLDQALKIWAAMLMVACGWGLERLSTLHPSIALRALEQGETVSIATSACSRDLAT